MNNNAFKSLIYLLIIFTGLNFTSAQSLPDLEKKYDQLNLQFEKENKILDSLKNIYTYRTSLIDIEKEKKNADNERIVEMMAGSVEISNKIESQNKKLSRIENDIENVKDKLHRIYIAKIDSLQNIKEAGKGEDDKIDSEILKLTEKNILVAPKILSLSFNPEKILEIDLQKTKDKKEKVIYKEYLNNALNEVNGLIESVNSQFTEVNQIVALQTKTKKFLEEAELESNLLIQRQNNVSTQTQAPISLREVDNSGLTGTSADFVSNIRTYQIILRQLDIQQLSKTDLNLKFSSEELNRNLDVKEYQRLLKEVKERLQEFKLVLANKIGSGK